jgi:hypothetical protein
MEGGYSAFIVFGYTYQEKPDNAPWHPFQRPQHARAARLHYGPGVLPGRHPFHAGDWARKGQTLSHAGDNYSDQLPAREGLPVAKRRSRRVSNAFSVNFVSFFKI